MHGSRRRYGCAGLAAGRPELWGDYGYAGVFGHLGEIERVAGKRAFMVLGGVGRWLAGC